MSIPAHDLKTQYESIRDEIDEALRTVKENTDFILGEAVERFEENFASYCGTDHCIGVSSGTSALRLVYEAYGLGEEDEVITTPFTFIATVEPLVHMGVEPVFADIDPTTYNLDPDDVERKITEDTEAIVAVHLYGQPTGIDRLREIAEAHDLPLIEDAAQAQGARWRGDRAGSLGDAATFSFYPGKNLGAFGDAGGITTDDDELAETIRGLRDHGRSDKYAHAVPGFNHRMDGLQGAVLDVKLNHLDDWNDTRRSNAQFYNDQLRDLPVTTPTVADGAEHVYHQYAIRVDHRDAVKDILHERDIGAGVHYPKPLHRQPSLEFLPYEDGDFPEAEAASREVLSLPVHSLLEPADRETVVEALGEAIEQTHSAEE